MMTNVLLGAAVAVPIGFALLVAARVLRPDAAWPMPVAVIPALLATVLADTQQIVAIPWLLLGSEWQLDEVRRPLLGAAALIWMLASLQQQASPRPRSRTRRYVTWWLLTMAGNFGLLVAQDAAIFYTFFALMTFGAWPLIGDRRTRESAQAGRVYLVYAVAGEVLMLAGLLAASGYAGSLRLADLGSAIAASPHAALITGILLAGFGVKSAVLGLHSWMPVAYAHAPAPVAAVLGGATINAGVVGMLATLPFGYPGVGSVGGVAIVLGLSAAFAAVAAGLLQRQARGALAYSSISQMGLILVLIGAALTRPEGWLLLQWAIVVYATHHALAKGALFLGVDAVEHGARSGKTMQALLFGIPSLALAGAPFTSGAVAKLQMKSVLATLTASWPLIGWLLTGAAVATTLIMARFLWIVLVRPTPSTREPRLRDRAVYGSPLLPASWMLAVLAVITGVYLLPTTWQSYGIGTQAVSAWSLLAPVLIGVVASWLSWRSGWRFPTVPPGDLLWPLERLAEHAWRRTLTATNRMGRTVLRVSGSMHTIQQRIDAALVDRESWDVALRRSLPLLFSVLLLALLWLL